MVIGDSTRRLIGDLFELVGLGSLRFKGFAEPARVWRVVGEGRAESRFEALHGARVAPLVGRSEELDLVLSRWRQAKGRAGQVLLIFGEPGIGKSRLVLALRERLKAEPITLVSYACSPHHSNSPLFPFILQLERAARFAPDDARKSGSRASNRSYVRTTKSSLAMQFRCLPICLEFRARRLTSCPTCLPSKGRRSCSGRSLAGSIDLQRVARS